MVNCQSTARCLVFVRLAQAVISDCRITMSAIGQALAGQATQFALRHVQPTAVLGSVDEVDPPHIRAGFLGRKRLVERALRMLRLSRTILARLRLAYRPSNNWATS